MMSETALYRGRPLVEAQQEPDPEKFVPVFAWDSKRVWVWVKKPGGKVVGPVEVPHDQVKKYKGKLGWLATKTEYMALLDPGWYDGPEDLYPATWKPGDSLAIEQFPKATINAKFEPFTVSAAKAEKKPTTIPPEFTLTGKKDPNGYPTAEDEGSGEEFSILPGGKIGQWAPKEGVYYIAKKLPGEDWEIHLDSPIYKPHDLEPKAAPLPMDPPEDFELPPNYTIKKVTPSHVVATTPDGTDVKWIKATNHWVHADDPTKDHDPLQASVPKKAAPKKKAKAKAKPSTPKAKPSTPKPEEKKVVSAKPEPAPHLTKYTGQVDENGLPLVDETPEGDYEEEDAAKGLTLMPDDRVARWRPQEGHYLLYDYDPYFGFMFSKSGETITSDEAKQLMAALHLTVHAGRYHKYDVVGAEGPQPTTYTAPLPPHSKAISDKDVNGLPMVLTIPEDPYDDSHKLSAFPNGCVGKWDQLSKKYLYWEWREILGDYNYFPTHPSEYVSLKEIQKMQVQSGVPAPTPVQVAPPPPPPQKPKPVVNKPAAPPPSPATTTPQPTAKPAQPPVLAGTLKPTGKKDPKGYDLGSYHGSTYSMLPGNKVGVWSDANGGYIIYKYDPTGDSFYNTTTVWAPPGYHKALAFVPILGKDHAQLEDSTGVSVVVLANGKFAKNEKGGWWVYKVDPAQGKKFVPTGEEIDTDTMIAIAKDPIYKSLKPTGLVDENSLPTYSGKNQSGYLAMLPDGTMARWSPTNKVYRKFEHDPSDDTWSTSDPPEKFSLDDINAMYLKAGATPIKSPEAPATASPKIAPKSKPETGPLPEPAFVTPAGVMPDPSTLEDIGGGGLKGTTPGRTVLRDPKTGQRYLFKPAVQKFGAGEVQPFKAKSQEAFAVVAAIVRPDAHVPVETVQYKGKLGTIQPMMDVDPKQPDLNGVLPSDLTGQQKVDVASEHMLDWLMSQHDSFASNFIVTKEGRVVGIDKEQGWKYLNDPKYPDRLATDYKPNSELYGEQEPYYNKFWRAFADGKMEFDPQQMTPALTKLEAMDANVLEKALESYAATVSKMQGPEKTYERYAFVKQILSRRATLRADFEKFITEQYRKREGVPGKFTFNTGWVPEGTAAQAEKYQTLTLPARDWVLKEFGSKGLKPHKDYPEYILVRVTADEPVTKVQEFLSNLGVEPVTTAPGGGPLPTTNPIMGSNYNSVIVRVSDLEKMVQRTVEIKQEPGQKYANYKGAPTYQSEALAPPDAPGDVQGLATTHDLKLGPLGKNFTLDADAVEQQTASVQRVISVDGETRYVVHFKLREPYWKPIMSKGKSGSYTWPLGAYDAEKDALVESPYIGGSHSEPGRVFTSGQHQLAVLGDSSRWAFRGSVYADIHVKSGTTVLSALKTLMKMLGLEEKVIKDPSPEDIEVYNMVQALWALAPKKHASLTQDDFNVPALRKKLKGVLTNDQIDSIRQVKGTAGRGSPIIPGLWKTLGGGTPEAPVVRFLFWTVNTTGPAKIFKSAATGIHERLRMGMGSSKGASVSSDMHSGGADLTTMRLATEGGKNHGVSHVGSVSRPVKLIIAPEILDRLDVHIAAGDSFGCTNPNSSSYSSYFNARGGLDKDVAKFNKGGGYGGSTEVCVRRGVPPEMIKRVCCSNESDRKSVLENCEKAGITEFNGCPIEDFIVVEDNQGAIYNKFLKPLGY